jgi:aryl-alcohol dehydrogenase-like predicted oxidoreductase
LPLTEPKGIGLVVFSPLASGILTGKYDNGIPQDSRMARLDWLRDSMFRDEIVDAVRQLKPIADELGVTRAQLAIAWTLRQPGVSSAITGATKARQLEETLQAVDITLDGEVLARIDNIVKPVAG